MGLATDGVAPRPVVTATGLTSAGQTALRPGQIVAARVESHLPDGTARLAFGETRIDVRLPGRAETGATLRLQVLRTAPDLAFTLLGRTAGPSGTPGAYPVLPKGLQADLQNMIRTAIVDQDSVAPLLTGLDRLLSSGGTAVPQGVRQAMEQLLGLRLPVNPAPSGEALRDAIKKSGVFLEANLARGSIPAHGGDMKAALLALQAGLRLWLGGGVPAADAEAAKSLLSQTRAALSRLRLAQTGSLPDPAELQGRRGEKPAEWVFELPFHSGDRTFGVQLRIEREGGGGGAEEDESWRIRFSVDAEPLGPVHAVVTLRGGALGISIWAERDNGADLLRRRVPDLAQALERSDLEVAGVNVSVGSPPRRAHPSGAVIDRRT